MHIGSLGDGRLDIGRRAILDEVEETGRLGPEQRCANSN
jgi:hypothetical protein